MSASSHARVAAIVVTYHPDPVQLSNLFISLQPQVSFIVWVDNGTHVCPDVHLPDRAHCQLIELRLLKNEGLAVAQNRGIKLAVENGASHILLLDQDSLPEKNMVSDLLAALERRHDAAAVGPRILLHDKSRKNKNRTTQQSASLGPENAEYAVDSLIASGCLFPAERIKDIGLMRDDWFIDWLDVEWCWRANDLGYRVYQVPSALMHHKIGESDICVFGRIIHIHPPWRHYYQARNGILILCTTRPKLYRWVQCVPHQLARFMFFSLCIPPRHQYLAMWLKGWWDGLRGHSGQRIIANPPHHVYRHSKSANHQK